MGNHKAIYSLINRVTQAVYRPRKDTLFKTKNDKIDTLIKTKNDKIDTLIKTKIDKLDTLIRTKNDNIQPLPQGFSLKKWVFKGKALGTRLDNIDTLFKRKNPEKQDPGWLHVPIKPL